MNDIRATLTTYKLTHMGKCDRCGRVGFLDLVRPCWCAKCVIELATDWHLDVTLRIGEP